MILPFSTQLNGKPTYFVEKILKGLVENDLITTDEWSFRMQPMPIVKYPKAYGFVFYKTLNHQSKLHTIREDKTDRWKPGTKIDFFINCRQPNMFRFAPVLPVVSVQEIEIVYCKVFGKTIHPDVLIDNVRLHPIKVEQLAQNDGFDSDQDFFAYFNKDFTGKIIHWTDLKY